MWGKKEGTEENIEHWIGRRDREEKQKEKIGWNKVYKISSLLNMNILSHRLQQKEFKRLFKSEYYRIV